MRKKVMSNSKSLLIKSKSEVEKKINDFIDKGNNILQHFNYEEFSSWCSYTSEFLKQVFDNPDNEYKEAFDSAGVLPIYTNLSDIHQISIDELKAKIHNLNELKQILELIPCKVKEKNDTVGQYDSKKVFIVHGHDTALKETVARTLERLGLEPIILHEQQNNGKTIIEKFESNADNCGFAIILLTADDWGYAKEENEDSRRPRARQNVVFEMGFFCGKLGRDRVFLLLDNGVDKPGDLDGIVYNPTNEEMWKIKLVKELKSSGYDVDANKIF